MTELVATETSSVKSFYKNKSVLITSPADFWAKFLIFKLLQSCQVNYIYIFLRPKKKQSLQDSYDEFLKSDIFAYLGSTTLLEKVVPIASYPSAPHLGLNDKDLRLLLANVNVVFHSTDGSGKLNRSLKSATNMHVNTTKNIVKLAENLPHLDSFVYVSTLNAHFDDGYLEEQNYPLKPYFYKLDPIAFWNKIKDMDDKYVERIKPSFMGKHPNTYSFAMALSENLIWEKRDILRRSAIVRPSCLSAAYSEPDHGWLDGLQLPTSLMTLHAMGITRAVNDDVNKVLPLVPVDKLVNGLLTIGWYMATRSNTDCLVYNFSSDESNGVTVGQIQKYASDAFYRYPSTKAIRVPVAPKPQSALMYRFNQLISETLFAYFFDFLLVCTGKSPMLVDMMRKMQKSLKEVASTYYKQSYAFGVVNVKKLQDLMSDEDRLHFNCDLSDIDWPQHFDDCYMRFRRYVLKEPDNNVKDAMKRVEQLMKVYDTIKYASWAVMSAGVAVAGYYALRAF